MKSFIESWHKKPTEIDFAAQAVQKSRIFNRPGRRRRRIFIIKLLALIWVCILIWRLYSIQIADFDRWRGWALKQHIGELQIASERGPIYDRNQNLLTVSVPAGSVYARPKIIKEHAIVAEQISKILEEDPSIILDKLNTTKPFVWLKRQIPRVDAKKIEALKIEGIGYFTEAHRYYPNGFAAGTLLGRVGIDGNGLTGLEAAYESELNGNIVKAAIGKDALGNVFRAGEEIHSLTLPKGKPLVLTIDAGIQSIVDQELELGRKKANAKSAMAVMLDANSGEILAMSQAPLINLNDNSSIPTELLRNQVVETVFEPGSIMKPLVIAAALDFKLITPDQKFDCEKGRYSFGGRIIKDVHGQGIISVHDINVRSSNIGMTKIGALLGKERLYAALKNYGFGELIDLKLPGQTPGIFRNVNSWATVDIATHSFGQGIAVTPLQILRAVASIANDGTLPSLSLVKGVEVSERRRVMSEATAAETRNMMYAVVEDPKGTGKQAYLEGIKVGGKTGTAQKAKADGRGYEPGKYIASFVGFADASSMAINEKLVLAVIIDEPNTTTIYGGTLAAPVFKRIIQKTVHHLATQKELTAINMD